MKNVFEGLGHLHKHNLAHRDLKPSNIVIDDPNDSSTVRIVDFGLAVECTDKNGGGLQDFCGTLVYQSPEQLKANQYGKPADIWACGFIMYELMSGAHPLYKKGEDKNSYKEKLLNLD